jgi:hypothetical protein
MEDAGELPKLARLALVVLLPLTRNPIESEQEASRLEMSKLKLGLIVANLQAARNLPGIQHIASRCNGSCSFESVLASEKRLRDCPDLVMSGSVRCM